MRVRALLFILPVLASLAGLGCSSVGSSAVRTDGGYARKHMGAVRIYAVVPPEGIRVIGLVEVHAINHEANVEVLMPEFMKRVAEIGGTGGIVDHVETRYEWRTEYRTESYAVPCGYRQTCWNTRIVPYTYQIRLLSIQGRAVLPIDAPGPPAIPNQGPYKPGATTAPPAPTAAPPPPPTTAPTQTIPQGGTAL